MTDNSDGQVPWVATSHGHGSLDLHATLGYDNAFAQQGLNHVDVTDDAAQEETALSRISLRENGLASSPVEPEEVKPVATIAPMMSLSSQNHVQPMIESVR